MIQKASTGGAVIGAHGTPLPLTFKDYRSDLKSVWCPGCGDFGVLNALTKAFADLGIARENTVVISGIGCSSRLPGYVETYGFNSVHGRALPIATGVKMSNPKLEVVVVGGDGDAFAIGAGHLPHAMRRNVDMAYIVMDNGIYGLTYIVMDNGIYGLTKGQMSPTSPLGLKGKSTPTGSIDPPLEPLKLALAMGCSWIGQGFSGEPKLLAELMVKAIAHKGFAFLNVFSPCVVFRGRDQYDSVREHGTHLPPGYDPKVRMKAVELIELKEIEMPLGVIYQEERPTYDDRQLEVQNAAKEKGVPRVEDIVERFLP
jgi:2-oxoglutarate/2-oxoacid ferredoxin oxidoreductase subunit beta